MTVLFNERLESVEVNQGFSTSSAEFISAHFFPVPWNHVSLVLLDLLEQLEFSQRQVGIVKIRIVQELEYLLLKLCLLGSHFAVPMVLDGVVSSSRQKLKNLRPFVTICLNCQGQKPLFFSTPCCLGDSFSKVVVPSFPALFASS